MTQPRALFVRQLSWRLLLAGAAIAAFCYLAALPQEPLPGSAAASNRALLASAAATAPPQRLWGKWGPRHIAALVLSVLVSLTSSIDRECGSSLYMVLFASLLDMPFRKAAAMTAFTVALGAIAPGVAAMSEPWLTERGVLALVDYPGCLVLLPTMFWGISFGVIFNLWWPNWLLALLWVVIVGANNIELMISFARYRAAVRKGKALGAQVRAIDAQLAPAGDAAATAAAGGGAPPPGGSIELAQPAAAGGARAPATRAGLAEARRQLMAEAQAVNKRAQRIEAVALLYPALYIRSLDELLKRVYKVDAAPAGLRAGATHSTLGAMDAEDLALQVELADSRTFVGRFTFRWKRWWALNNHFELSLVLKIVVLHLVTEAIRHHTAKPCTTKFWLMLVVMTGLVTAFLIFVVVSYSRHRLWRGPHWVDALAQVREVKKAERLQDIAAAKADRPAGSGDSKDITALPDAGANGSAAPPSAAAAAVAAGDAVAVQLPVSTSPAGAGSAAAAADADVGAVQSEEPQPGCCARLRKRLPWTWVEAPEALSNIVYCNSYNNYSKWNVPLILLCAALTMPIGVLGCALGLPGGPLMANMLLALGLKPHVVAGSCRFLVLCFTFGSFVAHIITGNLEPTLAAAFGVLNLGLAPLGLLLATRLRPRGAVVIGMSLVMGVVGLVTTLVWQLVPLLANLAAQEGGVPRALGYSYTVHHSIADFGNYFELQRFCLGNHYCAATAAQAGVKCTHHGGVEL